MADGGGPFPPRGELSFGHEAAEIVIHLFKLSPERLYLLVSRAESSFSRELEVLAAEST
jgi:hypothetical protein